MRIFRVGIEYAIRGDETVMLDLLSAERKILLQALRLDQAADSHTSDHTWLPA
jgi:hypothetical protein